MRINEILTESQLQQIEEGPILNKIGSVVGGAARGLAKGVGAVAGGVVGAGRAMKKGYQAGKAFVGDDPDPNKGQPGYDAGSAPAAAGSAPAAPAAGGAAAPAGGSAPAAGAPAAGGGAPSAQDINAAGPKGTAPATAQTGAAGAALAKTTAAVDQQTTAKAGQTVYAQVKANVDKLDKKGKQRILQLLQKSMATPDPKPAAGAAPAGGAAAVPATQGASPAAGGTGSGFNPDTGKPFASAADRAAYDASPAAKMPTADVEKAAGGAEAPANTMANAPVSATNTAAADNPNQPPPKKTGGKVAGQVSQTPGAIAKREKRQAAASAKSTGNKVFGQMANTLQQQNASKNNYGNALSEALALRVEAHKQKMFETGLSQGTISVFRK